MPGPLAKTNLAMIGSDEPLLRIRGKVLATIGCEAASVFTVEELRTLLEAAARPEVVLICHSAEEECAEQARNLALQAGVPTYFVERLIPPQQLVSDISTMLKRGSRRRKSVRGSPASS